jgi:predicted nucleotidyltransferase
MSSEKVVLTEEIREYLCRLVDSHGSVVAIWLIGSRANACWREDSDWGFLVFGDTDSLQSIRLDSALDRADVDILFVYDGNAFEEPWGEDPKKGGDLTDWKWSEVSEDEATYKQTKSVRDDENTEQFGSEYGLEFRQCIVSEARGMLIWRRSIGFVRR